MGAARVGFSMEFDTGNAAFDGGNGPEEVARILKHTAALIEFRGDTDGVVADVNGNRIGEWSVDFPESDEDDEDDES